MFNEKAKTADAVGAALEKLLGSRDTAAAGGVFLTVSDAGGLSITATIVQN